jgi:hypothetical protein
MQSEQIFEEQRMKIEELFSVKGKVVSRGIWGLGRAPSSVPRLSRSMADLPTRDDAALLA